MKHDAFSNEIMLQFRLHLNITKLGEITAFIIKEMEDERNTNRESRVCFAYKLFIFVPEKSKQRDELRIMRNPVAVHF